MFDTARKSCYSIGGDERRQDGPQVYGHTWLDGDRRLALVHTNPYNPDAVNMLQERYLPAIVMEIKKLRGWDYGSYDLYVSPPNCLEYERVKWAKDPFTGEPTFGVANVPVKEEEMSRMVRSFEEKRPEPARYCDKDLSQHLLFDDPLDPM